MDEKTIGTVRAVTLAELLQSREERAARQKELLSACGTDGVLVSVTLNIPGAVKDTPSYRAVMETGMQRLAALISSEEILHREVRELVTGPEGYLVARGRKGWSAREVKRLTVSLEEEQPLGRLFDMDVMDAGGSVSRKDLGLPARKCLLCDDDAKVCARSRRHKMEDLLAEIDRLLKEAGI